MSFSSSAIKFFGNQDRCIALCKSGTKTPSNSESQIFYHSALASAVATWDAYIHDIVKEFFSVTSIPALGSFNAVHTLLRNRADAALGRFNTPNWENTRNLLVTLTGYDPISDWQWPARHMNILLVKERLNQILKVRHSFAHGFSLPSFPWIINNKGKTRLTKTSVEDSRRLLHRLVKVTDAGLAQHIIVVYGLPTAW